MVSCKLMGSRMRMRMEHESWWLAHQRDCYLDAAKAAPDKRAALRHLLHVERLTQEIESLQVALASLDDVTQPITLAKERSALIYIRGLGPITPPMLVD